MPVPLSDWLALMQREYLASYVPRGGGAVRFVVGDAERLAQARRGLLAAAGPAGLVALDLDCASVKVNMLQQLFFAVAQALDWEALAQARLELLTADAGYHWPQPGRRVPLAALADANNLAPALLKRELLQHITQQVWRDRAMAQDFRKAMMALLEARLDDDRDALRDGVVEWLRGEVRTLKPVREAQIGQRIGLQNARAMLLSVCHWLRQCRRNGLLVVLDIRQLMRERRELADGLAYTPATVMAAYEVIRQVIDDAEHYSGLFLAVLADGRLLDGSAPKRDLGAYDALRLRLSNDVRPAVRDNPLAPLVMVQ